MNRYCKLNKLPKIGDKILAEAAMFSCSSRKESTSEFLTEKQHRI